MGRPKIYTINEEYFNTPLNEKKSYLIGLILSDGHLNYDKGYLQYACKKDDIELIEFIKKELNSSHPIKEYQIKNNWYVRYSITNKKLIKSLIDNYNLPKFNKSQNNLSIPKNISNNLLHHFLRGLFDGDGSIWTNRNKEDYCFSYTGGENLMVELKSIFYNVLNHNGYISYKYSKNNKNSCNLTYHGNLIVNKFFDYLYKDATCYLKRKYEKFQKCKITAEITINNRFNLNGNENKIKELYLTGFSQKEISDKLKLIYSSVRCCIQRLRKNKEII